MATPSYYGQWFVPATITYNGQTYSTGGYAAPVNYDTNPPKTYPVTNADGTISYGGPTTSGSGSGSGDPGPSRTDLIKQFQMLMPWLPETLIKVYTDAWIEYGDPDLAMAAVRQHSSYDSIFPGIRREDGSLRFSEGEYMVRVEAYKGVLDPYGLSSLITTSRIVQLIEGGVDPGEFQQRIDYVYTQVVTNLPEIRAAYATEFGINATSLSLASIFASAIDPDVSPVEMEFKIRRAQITGEASVAGFSIPIAESTRLAEFGLDQQAARTFYSQARSLLPTLGTLVERHNDPDDTFDLSELTDALVFLDPDEQQRISRLFAQEESMFNATSLFSLRQGAIPGLVAD